MSEANWGCDGTCAKCLIIKRHKLAVKSCNAQLAIKQDVVDILKSNTYRCSREFSNIDVSYTDLSDAYMVAKKFSEASFAGCALHGVRFDNSDLRGASLEEACVDKETTFRLADLDRCNLDVIDVAFDGMDLRYARNLHKTSKLPYSMRPRFSKILKKGRRHNSFINFFLYRRRSSNLVAKLFKVHKEKQYDEAYGMTKIVEDIGCLLFAQRMLVNESRNKGCVTSESSLLDVVNREINKIKDKFFCGSRPNDFFDNCEEIFSNNRSAKETKIMRKFVKKEKKIGYLSAVFRFLFKKKKKSSRKYTLDLEKNR